MIHPGPLKKIFTFSFPALLILTACIRNNPAPSGATASQASLQPEQADAPKTVVKDTLLDETANLLAGYPVRMSAVDTSNQKYKAYLKNIESDWKIVKRNKIGPITNWSKNYIREHSVDTATLFYPFSGADFLYPHSFFPNAADYILIGLEPVGSILRPDTLQPDELARYLGQIRASIYLSNNLGFFRTKSMETDFNQEELNGTLPVLAFYLKRTHHTLLSLTYFNLDTAGNIIETGNDKASGCRISYCDSLDTDMHNLYYLSFDLSDGNLESHPGLFPFLTSFGDQAVFLKAASYLMFLPDFELIRDYILDHSTAVLQDDSGIPYRKFPAKKWNISLFGTYTGTIDLFKYKFQPDLKEAYAKQQTPMPVPFRIGYNVKSGETNLLYATRIQPLAAEK